MLQCPYNSNEFCVSDAIMVDASGRCFDIARGFSQDGMELIKNIVRPFLFEDIEIIKDKEKEQVETKIEENNETNNDNEEVKNEQQLENQEE